MKLNLAYKININLPKLTLKAFNQQTYELCSLLKNDTLSEKQDFDFLVGHIVCCTNMGQYGTNVEYYIKLAIDV